MMRLILLNVPRGVLYIPAGLFLVEFVILVWCTGGFRKRWLRVLCAALVFAFSGGVLAHEALRRHRTDFLLRTANERINSIRKAPALIRILDARGMPVAGATVRVEQQRHAFLFGCNAFRLYFSPDELDSAYAARFSALFNYATLPFYWELYEPQPGNTSLYDGKHRRLAGWFEENHIETKGHPLVWHELYPSWAPAEPDAAREALHRRVTTIVGEHKSTIHRWDVVNEATFAKHFKNGVGRWAVRDGAPALTGAALNWAHEADPRAELVYNDFNIGATHVRLLKQLVKDKAPFHIIGIQSHMHRREWTLPEVWDICEEYSNFGKALHFSEVTVLSGKHGWELKQPWPTTPEGEQRQAEYVERLYTVLFSHPGVQAITWWDLQDGAWQGAPSGLLRADLTPKPAYNRLLKLIHDNWWTRESLVSDENGVCRFSGFLGDYKLAVRKGALAQKAFQSLVKGTNDWSVRLK